MVNQQFRRDYWVKGPTRLSALRQGEILRQQRVMLVTPPNEFIPKLTGALGEADISGNRVTPVMDLLADYRPRTLGEIETALAGAGATIAQVYEMVMILAGKGDVTPVQSDDAQAAAKPATERLNRFLMDRARGSAELPLLASPVTGGGFPMTRFQFKPRDGADRCGSLPRSSA